MELKANQTANGTFGRFWWDGEEIFEIESFSATVKPDYEKIGFNGTLDEDAKLKGLSGEGKFKVKFVFSRGLKKMLDAWKQGKDVRGQFVSSLEDPDSVDGQKEQISIGNAWFTQLVLADWEHGKIVEKEYPFNFTPSSADIRGEIN